MADIVVKGDNGTQAIIETAQPAAIVVSGTLQGPAGPPGPPGANGINGTGGGGSGGALWGDITGALTDQTDLVTALANKLTGSSNLSDIPNLLAARTNLGVAIGADVQAEIAATLATDYYRGDKVFADLNTVVRANRLDQMTGPANPVNMLGQRLISAANPISDQDAATKKYVDSVVQGLNVKSSVQAATAAALAANTYSAGVITASANGALVVDGVTVSVNDRVLVKDETSQLKNGIYTVTATGDLTHPFILTRSTDMDSSSEIAGAFTFVTGGTANANGGYVVAAAGPFTIGTTAIPFTQFSSSSVPDATTIVKGKATLGATGGAATFDSDALKAVDTAVVHNTGAETVAGIKTFSSAPVVPSAAFPESAVTNLTTDLAAKAPTSRTISTTAPLTGGGDLSADRTLAVSDATTSGKGVIELAGDLGGTAASPKVKRVTRFIVAPYGDTRPADYQATSPGQDDVAINAAITAANAQGGGTVELLDGTFTLSGAVIPLNFVWLKGQGMFSTRLKIGGSHTLAFAVLDNTSVYTGGASLYTDAMISDLEVDSSNLLQSSETKCFASRDIVRCKFFNLYMHDSTATGFGPDDLQASVVDNVIVVNCGYENKHTITGASWSGGVFTFTVPSHGYVTAATAAGLLTATGTIADGDTVTVDTVTYTFRNTISAAYDVAIGGSTANGLTNLKAAVNLTGTPGIEYAVGTIVKPSPVADTLTSTTLHFTAAVAGASSNSKVTTAMGGNMSFGASTLTGGVTASKITVTGMTPAAYNGAYNVTTVVDANTFTVSGSNNTLDAFNFAYDPGTATVFGVTSDSLIGHNGFGIASSSAFDESTLVVNCIAIGNQNNNFLIEADSAGVPPNTQASYIFSNCVSINAGSAGFRNTASRNTQINNCYDYGSLYGYAGGGFAQGKGIEAASWSGGVATITIASALSGSWAVGDKVTISGMTPTAWNGYFTIASIIDSTHFTVNMVADPGTVTIAGSISHLVHPIDGSQINGCIFSYNNLYGIKNPGGSEGLEINGAVVDHCLNVGVLLGSGYGTVSDLRIHDCGQDGLDISTTSGSYQPLADLTLSNVVVRNNGQRSAGTYDGISIAAVSTGPITHLTLSNVHSVDSQDTPTQRYGFILNAGGTLDNISINASDFHGNATGQYFNNNSSNTIYTSNIKGANPKGMYNLGTVTGSPVFNVTQSNFFCATLGGNITPVFSSSPVNGALMTTVFIQDATGGRTVTLPANAKPAQGGLTLSTTAAAVDVVTWAYDNVGKWRETSRAISDLGTTLGTLNKLVITTPIGNNNVSLNITQNDTTNNPNGASIMNAGTAHGQLITQGGVLAANKYGLFVDTNAVQVNSPLARMRQQNANSTQATLQLDNAGSGAALAINSGNLSMAGGTNIVAATTTGTKIGTATNQKLAFYNSTPIAQPTGDIITALQNLGLIASATISEADVANLVGDLALKAPLASPALTGTPTAPTASAGNNSTQVATTAYVDSAVGVSGLTATNIDILQRATPIMQNDFLFNSATAPFRTFAIASGSLNQASISSSSHPGILRVRNSTTTNSGAGIGSDTNALTLAGGEKCTFIVHFPVFTSSTYYLGFHNAATSTAPTQGAYLKVDSSGVATGQTVAGAGISSTGSTTTLSAATWYTCEVVVNSNATLVTFNIYSDSGTLVWSDTLSTAIPTSATGCAAVATSTTGAAADILNLDYMSLVISRALTRH